LLYARIQGAPFRNPHVFCLYGSFCYSFAARCCLRFQHPHALVRSLYTIYKDLAGAALAFTTEEATSSQARGLTTVFGAAWRAALPNSHKPAYRFPVKYDNEIEQGLNSDSK